MASKRRFSTLQRSSPTRSLISRMHLPKKTTKINTSVSEVRSYINQEACLCNETLIVHPIGGRLCVLFSNSNHKIFIYD